MNFFDFKEKVDGRKARTGPEKTPGSEGSRQQTDALTITQLTAQIDRTIRSGFPSSVLVKGELSNCRVNASSGHIYFTLKDAGACIGCVMWKSDASRLRFTPTDGMELLVRGTIQVYAQQGKYQLYATSLQPLGKGALELAFQQTKAKLEAEGLFAQERKRPLPPYPTCIALVTSSGTAALQDMLKVLRRFPWIHVLVYHVPVQGDGCGPKIAEGIQHLGRQLRSLGGLDLIVLSRGGGSLEDLWGFNEEVVARAIATCPVPVVTGIGHEVDTSIADLVADYHAHTPTEAAQVITAEWRGAAQSIENSITRLERTVRGMVQYGRQRLIACARHEMFRRPMHRILALQQFIDERDRALANAVTGRLERLSRRVETFRARLGERHPRASVKLASQRLDSISARLERGMTNLCARQTQRVETIALQLAALSPDNVLKRGYSITTRKRDGAIIRNQQDVRAGEKIVTRVAEGQIESIVDDASQPRLFES
jgi:exodeoxyribonuclease VII large subunit